MSATLGLLGFLGVGPTRLGLPGTGASGTGQIYLFTPGPMAHGCGCSPAAAAGSFDYEPFIAFDPFYILDLDQTAGALAMSTARYEWCGAYNIWHRSSS